VTRLLSGGMVLGVMSETTYEQIEVPLAPGDRLILYTDGIVEVENPAGEDYGEARLGSVAAEHRARAPQAMLDTLFADVSGFAAGQFADDATLIVAAID
jgi:phosphoserine phosphatase RsbU/P